MPAFFVHGYMGYLLYGYEGLLYGMLPDIIGFSHYFYKLFKNYSFDLQKNIVDEIHSNKMTDMDWMLYNISHSLLPWITLLVITKNKAIYAAIIGIVFDILLHSEERKGWRGPKYLYPLSHTYFDGTSWSEPKGMIITAIILFLFIQYKTDIKNKLII